MGSEKVVVPAFRYGNFIVDEAVRDGIIGFPKDGLHMETNYPGTDGKKTWIVMNWTTLPAQVVRALYEVGRCRFYGSGSLEGVPKDVIEMATDFYAAAQGRKNSGLIHPDYVEIVSKGIPGGLPIDYPDSPGEFRLCRYHRDVGHLDPQKDPPEMTRNERTRTFETWLPPAAGRFVMHAGEGTYNKDTGMPVRTTGKKEEALGCWTSAGLSQMNAEAQLSRFDFDETKDADGPYKGGYIPISVSGDQFGPLSTHLVSLRMIDLIQMES